MFHTKFGENRSRPLIFRIIWTFEFFLSWYQISKFQYIHEASSVWKPKSSFLKSVRAQYGNPDSHTIFLYYTRSCTFIFKSTKPSQYKLIFNEAFFLYNFLCTYFCGFYFRQFGLGMISWNVRWHRYLQRVSAGICEY